MKNKTISVVLLLTVLCGVFFACDPPETEEEAGFKFDQVIVYIKEEFFEKFDAEEFTVEDFEWSNVKSIEYNPLYSLNMRYFVVYLKKHGKKQVLDAVAHFNTLDFVENAKPSYIITFVPVPITNKNKGENL